MSNQLKTYNIEDIRKLKPCYDPSEKLPENWTGTVVDILKLNDVKVEDKIWVATKFLNDKQNRLFAVYCVREALKLINNPDKRSIEACNVAERFVNGEVTKEELATAYSAAAAAHSAAAAAASAADCTDNQLKRLIEAIENKEWD